MALVIPQSAKTILPSNGNIEGFTINRNSIPEVDQLLQKGSPRQGGDKTAFIFNTSRRPIEDQIIMLVNPQQMKWQIGQRTTRSDVFGGTIIHKWKNMGDSSADIPQLTISMSTGLIYPTMAFTGGAINSSYATNKWKASIFYKFLEMVHEPAFTDEGEPNFIEILTSTLLFPNVQLQFVLTGGFDWTEIANDPFQVQFTMSGLVVKSNPAFAQFDALLNEFNVNVGDWNSVRRV